MKVFVGIVLFVFFLFNPTKALASTFYVDSNLPGNCSGNYSVSNRDCSGADGNAYQTVASGTSVLQAGDTMYIRGGSYTTNAISLDITGSTTTISAYNNETVTITKSAIRMPLFGLSDSTSNITFSGLILESQLYSLISGSWTNTGSNVWTISLTPQPTQIRFNTTIGTNVEAQGDVNSANKWFWSGGTLYIYSTSDPATLYTTPGVNQTDNYDAIGIGNTSGVAGNLVTIDNCTFQNFAHSGVKGNYRFHVSNSKFASIGTDDNDHNIYLTGEQTVGNESVIEYNDFGYTPGALIHLYSHPSYIIVRYNILNGESSSLHSTWGVLLSGNHIKIYNNSFYGNSTGITFYTSNSHDNEVINNIFYGNTGSDFYIDSYGGSFFPVNNVSNYNYFGSTTKCSGCTDQSGSGGDNYSQYISGTNIQGSTNPYSETSFDSWSDFAIASSSTLIDSGYNLGVGYGTGIDSRSSTWPANKISQDGHGDGWDIGAFVYYVATATQSPSNSTSSSSSISTSGNESCSDPAIITQVNLFEIRPSKTDVTIFFTGVENANKYLVFYGPINSPNQYATWLYSNSKAVISQKISYLKSNSIYSFRVLPATDCQAGKSSNVLTTKTLTNLISNVKTKSVLKTEVVKLPVQLASPNPTITQVKPETEKIVQQEIVLPKKSSLRESLLLWLESVFTP